MLLAKVYNGKYYYHKLLSYLPFVFISKGNSPVIYCPTSLKSRVCFDKIVLQPSLCVCTASDAPKCSTTRAQKTFMAVVVSAGKWIWQTVKMFNVAEHTSIFLFRESICTVLLGFVSFRSIAASQVPKWCHIILRSIYSHRNEIKLLLAVFFCSTLSSHKLYLPRSEQLSMLCLDFCFRFCWSPYRMWKLVYASGRWVHI